MARAAFDAFLAGHQTPEKALLPAVEPLAARVGSMDLKNMMSDPANWSANLAKTGRLLELSGLILGLDATLVAEAYGLAPYWEDDIPRVVNEGQEVLSQPSIGGRLGSVLDALDRLVQTQRPHYGCVAGMAGPAELAQMLFADSDGSRMADLKQSLVELAEAFCKLRPDMLLFREGAALGNTAIGMQHRKAFNTLKNMAGYFNVSIAIYLEGYDSALLPDLAKLKVPFILLGADKDGRAPEFAALRELASSIEGIGVPLPFDDIEQATGLVDGYKEQLEGVNYLYTSMHELPRDTDLEMAREIKELIGI